MIDLLPEEPKGTISIEPNKAPISDQEIVRSKVQKADYSLGEKSPGQEELAGSYNLGMEDRVQEQASLAEAIDRQEAYHQVSSDLVRGAAAAGRPLDESEKSFILDRPEKMPNPETALEERFANRAVRDVTKTEDPLVSEPVPEAARSALVKQQLAQKVYARIKQRYDDSSWTSWVADVAKGIAPFYSWLKQTDNTKDSSAILTGNNIADQMTSLYFLPADEFVAELQKKVDALAEDNIVEAVNFAQHAIRYSSSDQYWDNVFFGMDAADIATLGAGKLARSLIRGGAKVVSKEAEEAAVRKVRDLVEETADPKATMNDVKVVLGDAKGAADDAVKDRLGEVTPVSPKNAVVTPEGTRPEKVLNDATKTATGMADPENYMRRAGSLTNERQRRILETLEENKNLLRSSLTDVTHVVTNPVEAAADQGFKEAEAQFRRTNYRLEDSIVEVTPNRESLETFGGVDRIDILLGNKDALPFTSIDQAENYAKKIYKLPEGGYTVKTKGNSYFLQMEQGVDETSPSVLNLRLTTENKDQETFINQWLGWIRNPDDVRGVKKNGFFGPRVTSDSTKAAKVATYGANAVMSKLSEVAKSIGGVSKAEHNRLAQIMDAARFKKRKVLDPETKEMVTVSGTFYDTVADFEKAYQDRGWALPTDKEIESYFSFRQVMDYDYSVRNISIYKDKYRKGINQKSVAWVGVDEAGKSKRITTPFFEGKTIDQLPPRSGSSYNVGWVSEGGKSNFLSTTSIGAYGKWKEVDDLLAKGYHVIQVSDDKALRSVIDSGGEPVQYILTKEVKEKPLSTIQVPYNEGGHWIYPHTGEYLKQAQTHKTKFGRRVYSGDVTAHYALSGMDKNRDAYETVRKMINEGRPLEEIDAFARKNTPYDGETFVKKFRTKDNPDAPFALDTPFVVTKSGQRAGDVANLKDILREEIFDPSQSEHSLMRDVNSAYAQERGERLTSVLNQGTEANPIFKLTGAPAMDTFEALARSSAQLAKSRFFDDFKHQAIENYVTQFADTMDISLREFRADPMRYLREPVWKKNYADNSKMAAARNSRQAMMYLLQQETAESRAINWTRQKMVDKVLKAKGGDASIADPWMWDSSMDPGKIARSAVFHKSLGLFNPVQYPLQASAIVHVAAIDGNPIRAVQANFLYWSMRMRGLAETNTRAQGLFGRIMSRALGVSSEAVEEMYDLYKRTGASKIEGEFARLDDYMNPREFFGPTGVSKGLDAGTIFFKEGNMTHKGVAFATSYLRWKAANPLKKINAKDIAEIVDRMDLYYLNMSRASNNAILGSQTLSVPAQFTTFHTNVMAQLLGKRLTPLEKARMMTMYSAMYGLPVGAGLAVAPLWPVSESIRQYTMENGIDTDANLVTKFMMNGAASVGLELLTDKTWNFGDRYGPGGLSWMRDLTDGDLFDVATGASGSFLAEAYGRAAPFGRALYSVFSSDDDYYPLAKEDFIDAAREISSVNNAARAYYAVTTGQFLTKSNNNVMNIDADGVDAFMIGALGLSPQEATDAYIKLRSMREEDDAKSQIKKVAAEQFRRGIKSAIDGDEKASLSFFKKAHTILKAFTPMEQAAMFKDMMKDNQSLVDKVDPKFMMRDPEARFDNYAKDK